MYKEKKKKFVSVKSEGIMTFSSERMMNENEMRKIMLRLCGK